MVKPEAHELARQIGEQVSHEGIGNRDALFSTETNEYVLHAYLALTKEEQEMLPSSQTIKMPATAGEKDRKITIRRIITRMIKEQATMSTIRFEAKLFKIGSWTIFSAA